MLTLMLYLFIFGAESDLTCEQVDDIKNQFQEACGRANIREECVLECWELYESFDWSLLTRKVKKNCFTMKQRMQIPTGRKIIQKNLQLLRCVCRGF